MDADELLRPAARRPQDAIRRVADGLSQGEYPVDTCFLATLLALAAHDLRQPLQLITSAHDILATLLRGKEQRKELVQAVDATGQLAGMLDQLVEVLHLQERTREGLKIPVPLRPILDEIVAEFTEPARRKGIIFRVTTARGAALSHPVLLTSMVRNLVRNAIDYTPRGGRVFVTSRQHGPDLRVEVRDTGAGIRASVLATIFDAFQRADESRPDGLGLGLFIVKRAADLLGHRVKVQSVEGRGSRFTVVTQATHYRGPRLGTIDMLPRDSAAKSEPRFNGAFGGVRRNHDQLRWSAGEIISGSA
jgi:two-component system, OmpR family, phosphate regulon sensor histidine kinase PhoR